MDQSTGRTYGIRSCVIDGCRNDVVCLEVYIRNRREPLHEIHSRVCATHAISEGFRVAMHCDSHAFDIPFDTDEAFYVDGAIVDDIRRSFE